METDFDIKKSTSFKIGGKIARIYFPETIDEFIEISEPKIFVAGNLSNVLVSSYGYDGAVICTKNLNKITFEGNRVTAGAGVRGTKLSKAALEKGLSGIEFMACFPGSVGGEVFMNAGAHGQAVADVFNCAKVYSPEQGLIALTKNEMEFSYRGSICQKKAYTVLEAEFILTHQDKGKIQSKMDENILFRQDKQPSLILPNCGSVFKNPDGDIAGRLLEAAGVKGLKYGGVRVWENHANFIVNDGDGISLDVLRLMLEMYTRVKDKFNIELEPEIRFLGGRNDEEVEICRILYQE